MGELWGSYFEKYFWERIIWVEELAKAVGYYGIYD